MSTMAYQITSVSMLCSTVCSGADQTKHKSSASLAFLRGIHWCTVNSSHKGPVTRKMFWFGDIIMTSPGPWFNMKMPLNQYRNSHCGDKTILRLSYLHNGVRQHLYTESGPKPQWFNKPLVYCHQNIIYLQTINFSTSTNSSGVKTCANLMKIDYCIWNYNTNSWFGDKH